jgi:hypothetical protein
MLGAPPAAVAADLGCDVADLMGWVRAQRQVLQRAARPAAAEPRRETEAEAEAEGGTTPEPAPVVRPVGKQRNLGADRDVAPENSAVVDAAYRRAQFDYSGRRVRPAVTH